MQAPTDVAAPVLAPRHRFPIGLLLMAVGAALFVVGSLLLLVVYAAPPEVNPARSLPGPLIGGMVLLGGLTALAGMNGLLLGWGTSSGMPLPYGSHRSIIMTAISPIAFALLVCLPFLGIMARRSETAPTAMAIMVVFSFALYGGMLLVVYLQGVRSGLVTVETLGLRTESTGRSLRWGLAGAGATLFVGALYENVLRAFGLPQPQLEALTWLRGMPITAYIAVAFAGAVVAPIVEELFFRGYVFNAYVREKHLATAYIASALVFSALHGLPTLLPVIFAMGLVLAYVYRRTGSIIAPMITHVLNNSLAFVTLFASLQTAG